MPVAGLAVGHVGHALHVPWPAALQPPGFGAGDVFGPSSVSQSLAPAPSVAQAVPPSRCADLGPAHSGAGLYPPRRCFPGGCPAASSPRRCHSGSGHGRRFWSGRGDGRNGVRGLPDGLYLSDHSPYTGLGTSRQRSTRDSFFHEEKTPGAALGLRVPFRRSVWSGVEGHDVHASHRLSGVTDRGGFSAARSVWIV